MPSHVTHLLLAEDVANKLDIDALLDPGNRSYLALAAQGPDIFYHNQRRRPSGLSYGSLIHRHDYGTLCSEMAGWAWAEGLPLESWAGAMVVGFATHAILDRHTHPFINYFAGWVEPGDPHTNQFRSMHPFLERLIDVAMLADQRSIHPSELGFAEIVDCGDEPPTGWLNIMSSALQATYPKAARDADLQSRLSGAYLDTMGYYSFTNVVNSEYLETAIKREEAGQIGSRWLSVIHPPEIPAELDVLNRSNRTWCHPCSKRETHRESFLDLYADALAESEKVIATLVECWRRGGPAEEISRVVGNANLSDGRPNPRPCEKRHADPLPLGRIQERIRESIREGRGGRL